MSLRRCRRQDNDLLRRNRFGGKHRQHADENANHKQVPLPFVSHIAPRYSRAGSVRALSNDRVINAASGKTSALIL